MQNVICLGAGLAGLGFARSMPKTRVFEALELPGGHCISHNVVGVAFDEGTHICHSKDQEWLDLIYRHAGGVVHIPQSRVANYWHGTWVTYPVQNHLHDLPIEARIRAVTDFVFAQIKTKDIGSKPANYRQWCLSHYGTYLTERFYAEYTAKYWRIPMEELATDWVEGRLLPSQVKRIIAGAFGLQEERQSTFAKFHYPAHGGFYAFVRQFAEGLDIIYGARVVVIDVVRRIIEFSNGRREPYEVVASSIPLPELVHMIKDVPNEIVRCAVQLRYTQLICINLVLNRPVATPNHWFYIYDSEIEASRVSLPSNIAPGSAGEGRSAVQAEIFRRNDEAFDMDILVEKTVRDMARLLRFNPMTELVAAVPVHVPYGYVTSDLMRARAVATIRAWLRERGIYTMGLYGSWKYVWSDMAFRSGEQTAQLLRKKQ